MAPPSTTTSIYSPATITIPIRATSIELTTQIFTHDIGYGMTTVAALPTSQASDVITSTPDVSTSTASIRSSSINIHDEPISSTDGLVTPTTSASNPGTSSSDTSNVLNVTATSHPGVTSSTIADGAIITTATDAPEATVTATAPTKLLNVPTIGMSTETTTTSPIDEDGSSTEILLTTTVSNALDNTTMKGFDQRGSTGYATGIDVAPSPTESGSSSTIGQSDYATIDGTIITGTTRTTGSIEIESTTKESATTNHDDMLTNSRGDVTGGIAIASATIEPFFTDYPDRTTQQLGTRDDELLTTTQIQVDSSSVPAMSHTTPSAPTDTTPWILEASKTMMTMTSTETASSKATTTVSAPSTTTISSHVDNSTENIDCTKATCANGGSCLSTSDGDKVSGSFSKCTTACHIVACVRTHAESAYTQFILYHSIKCVWHKIESIHPHK